MKTAIEFKTVTRFFPPNVYAVRDVSFTVQVGGWTLIKGPSGSGKSTILHLAAGLDLPTSGEIWVGELGLHRLSSQERARLRRFKIGVVFQQYYLVPYLTALENVLLAQHFHSTTDVTQARSVLAKVGLSEREEHLPSELSGGEKQRLCVARSIVNSPEILLADEPTASLDEANQKQVLELFTELQRGGLTLLMTSHDPVVDSYAHDIKAVRFGQLVV